MDELAVCTSYPAADILLLIDMKSKYDSATSLKSLLSLL